MKKRIFVVFLAVMMVNIGVSTDALAGVRDNVSNFTANLSSKLTGRGRADNFQPYLEDARELQIPQWEHEDWYVEDWTSQKDGMTLIKGFYAADILRGQTVGHAELPVLVVGPNFYRLSGLDKRRVVHTVDATYGMTDKNDRAAFMLTDWNTKMPIGIFDKHGLRLH